VEHWQSASADTVVVVSAMECQSHDTDTCDKDGADIDMTVIGAENEHRLAAMSQDEILAKRNEILSTLGQLRLTFSVLAISMIVKL